MEAQWRQKRRVIKGDTATLPQPPGGENILANIKLEKKKKKKKTKGVKRKNSIKSM